ESRSDRQRRLGDVLPLDPTTVRLLWREARGEGIHRIRPDGIDQRRQQRRTVHGTTPWREYAPIHLESQQDAATSAAGSTDLAAGATSPSHPVPRRASTTQHVGRL